MVTGNGHPPGSPERHCQEFDLSKNARKEKKGVQNHHSYSKRRVSNPWVSTTSKAGDI